MSDDMLRLAHAGLAPSRIDRLVESWGSPTAVVDGIESGRITVADGIRAAVGVSAEVRRTALETIGATWVTRNDDAYPAKLGAHLHAPRWLFRRGETSAAPALAIVGTRTCTAYGIDLAMAYGAAAAEMGWTVVSGLARGIDRAGHVGALGASGHATAVLGSGIDVVYPRSNRDIHDQILESGGAVVSEFPPGTRPDGWRFPTRNRIIVGMSDIVLVVEAGETGGALITAGIALDWGVPVYATPADVDRPASAGTNGLIRDGAFPVFDADDLRDVLGLVAPIVRAGAA